MNPRESKELFCKSCIISTLILLDGPKMKRELHDFFFFLNKSVRDMQAGSQWVEAGSSAENYLFLVI